MPVFGPFVFLLAPFLLRPLPTISDGRFVREAVFSLPPRRSVPVKKVYLIVNPYGGKCRGKIVLEAALGTLKRRFAFSLHKNVIIGENRPWL